MENTNNVEGAGEGLFAKRRIESGELVALYNGTRTPPSLEDDWSDYRVHLTSELDIDIPDDMRELDQYCATLSHKANHSFQPNCRWSRTDHPRFGFICSITSSREIKAGEEVTVNYRLPLHHAPAWYVDCHQEYQKSKTEGVNKKDIAQNIIYDILNDITDRRQFQEQRMI